MRPTDWFDLATACALGALIVYVVAGRVWSGLRAIAERSRRARRARELRRWLSGVWLRDVFGDAYRRVGAAPSGPPYTHTFRFRSRRGSGSLRDALDAIDATCSGVGRQRSRRGTGGGPRA